MAGPLLLGVLLPGLALGQVPPPGRAHLFVLDLSSTPVGEFPTTITQTNGSIEVALLNGVPMLRAAIASEFVITLPDVLPADFTLEFDVVPKLCCQPWDLSFEGTPKINQGAGSAHILWDSDGYLAIVGGGGDNYESPMWEDLRAILPGVLTHVVAVVQGPTIRLYTNGRRHYTLTKRFARGKQLRVFLGGPNDVTRGAVYLAGLRIVAGAHPPTALVANPTPPAGQPGPPAGQPSAPPGTPPAAAAVGATGGGSTLSGGGPTQPAGATVMNDATPPTVHLDAFPAGITVYYSTPPNAVRYSVCRESPQGSPCLAVTTPASPLGSLQWKVLYDMGLPPGSTHTYRVSAWRSDGHFGESAPQSATAEDILPPANLQVVQDNSANGQLVLGWTAAGILDPSGCCHYITDHQLIGTGISTAQQVTGTQATVTLTPGVTSYEWKVHSMFPNPAGGWFASAPVTITYTPPAASVTAGTTNYRLVALGFRVVSQTNDDLLIADGAGDEVYMAAAVTSTNRNLDQVQFKTVIGPTYGDRGPTQGMFPGRIGAGTASPTGGLKTGDLIAGNLNLSGPTGSPSYQRFPLLLWEGALDDQSMVVVHPTLWEEDAGKKAFTQWLNRVTGVVNAKYGISSQYAGMVFDSKPVVLGLRDPELLGPSLDGAPLVVCVFQKPLFLVGDFRALCDNLEDRPIGLSFVHLGDLHYTDKMMVFTRSAIEKALAGPGPRSGLPAGIVIMSLPDPGYGATGFYELYLKIERMP